jgi:ubiquinone/menaquinone biosynthesis C-methylase UbiE
MSNVEKIVRNFYENFGWQKSSNSAEAGEDVLFRKFTHHYYSYHELVNTRTMKCFSRLTGNILIAGSGDLPETHCEIAQQFSSVCCIDISKKALHISSEKLGRTSTYIVGSILNIPIESNHFDAVYCAHVIYHIDQNLQSKAIRELLRVMRPSGRAVIIYRNPYSLAESMERIRSKLPLIRYRPDDNFADAPPLYYYAHPLQWWDQFRDESHVHFLPWDIMSAEQERNLFISGNRARWVYRFCAWYEKTYALTATKLWSYVIISLDKK